MIEIVDRNKDGKISYSEFRVNISLLSSLTKIVKLVMSIIKLISGFR